MSSLFASTAAQWVVPRDRLTVADCARLFVRAAGWLTIAFVMLHDTVAIACRGANWEQEQMKRNPKQMMQQLQVRSSHAPARLLPGWLAGWLAGDAVHGGHA